MDEQKFDKSMKIHSILRKNIKGRIFVTHNKEGLICININPGNNIMYKHFINDVSDCFDVYDIARKIEQHYRSWLNDRFFYTNY